MTQKKLSEGTIIGIVFSVLVVAGILYYSYSSFGDVAFGYFTQRGAVSACKQDLLDRLKSPGSADFVTADIKGFDGKSYEVYMEVDSQNGFGALLRTEETCYYNPKYKMVMNSDLDKSAVELQETLDKIKDMSE